MKQKQPQDPRNGQQLKIETAREQAKPHRTPDSKASRETFAERTKPPGNVGLANEVRPGLGTRGDAAKAKSARPKKAKPTPHDHDPLGRDAPLERLEPREQRPDSLAREQEHDTGVSGHTGGD